ncbi:MAG: 7-cyano-7-deazaguanine synthase QueC [Candidatus Gastranaerophilaceae bacterium]
MAKSIILLSGGLDSLVSLALTKEEYNVKLALTFDYGQKSAEAEILASKKICEHYNIEHKIIKLDWLKEITQTALVSEKEIPTTALKDLCSDDFVNKSAVSVWVPNRNGTFLNIAAAFADSYSYDYIIFGANKEEGATFPDNTQEFIDRINAGFEYSTQKKPKAYAPLINLCKNDIVKVAIEHCVPLELTRSCYSAKEKHCGVCESCVRLKRALEENNCKEIIRVLF